tara:strand:+ start:474 stop:659 length:186 start_codon:yes stop_codon:yes gene_type:complete
MKIKLINKDKPITQTWCFLNTGYCSSIIEQINSGKQIKVDRLPKPALEYVQEVKTKKNGGK